MEEDSLFDEFGNYIGPEAPPPDDEETGYVNDEFEVGAPDQYTEVGDLDRRMSPHDNPLNGLDETRQQQIVLHEDKKYYLSAEEAYGPTVETVVHDEDTQPLTEPIIAPIKVKTFQLVESHPIPTAYEKQ
jgi:U5 small nuclear ribonucleoprotein component